MKDLPMLKELRKRFGGIDRGDLLEMVGLEERRARAMPNLALFGGGLLLGIGIGLMLAPKPGAALRHDLRSRLDLGDDENEADPAKA